MSARAAWRLEETGFGPVYEYVAGKTDWLAADLPFEGTAQLTGAFTRRDVATVGEDAPASEALRRLADVGFGPVLVLNQAGVLMGAAHRDELAAAEPQTPAGTLMRFGVSTVRPSEEVADLVHRMGHAELSRVVVTRQDGTLVGLFFAGDVAMTDEDEQPEPGGGSTP
jgi:CBS-domain-containing membrane protein